MHPGVGWLKFLRLTCFVLVLHVSIFFFMLLFTYVYSFYLLLLCKCSGQKLCMNSTLSITMVNRINFFRTAITVKIF